MIQMFDEYDDSAYHFNAHYDFIAILRAENEDNFRDEEYEQDDEGMIPYLKGTSYITFGCREIEFIPF